MDIGIDVSGFLNTVATYTQEATPTTAADKQPKLGTVQAISGSSATIQFDGETVTSGKYYPSLATYVPKVGDRVLLLACGTTFVILGPVSGSVPALSGSTLTTTGNATIGGTISASNFKVNTDWALLSSVGSFVNGAATGSRPARIRSVTVLGTVYWEMAGEIDLSGYTGGGTMFSFTGGSGSAWAPTHEHDWSMVGGQATTYTGSFRMYWAPSGNMGVSPSPGSAVSYVSLDPIRIVDPKHQLT